MNETRDNNQMDEPKKNKCEIVFFCCHSITDPCVYFTGSDILCAYRNDSAKCLSPIPQVNKMVLMLKEAGIEVNNGN